MDGMETKAILSQAARHLQAALDLLDQSGSNIVMVARVSHLLEDVRLEIADLRLAEMASVPPSDGTPLPTA